MQCWQKQPTACTQAKHAHELCECKFRATIAQIRQHRWVAQDYEPCKMLQSVASTEISEYIFEEENVQPQDISQVSEDYLLYVSRFAGSLV